MRVLVPDSIAEVYAQYSESLGGAQAEQLMIDQLQRFAHVHPRDRFLTLPGATLGELEAVLQGGSVQTGKDLVEKVKRLADVRIGGVRVEFSPAALEEILSMAGKQGLSVEEFTRRTVEMMGDQFFHHAARVTVDPAGAPA